MEVLFYVPLTRVVPYVHLVGSDAAEPKIPHTERAMRSDRFSRKLMFGIPYGSLAYFRLSHTIAAFSPSSWAYNLNGKHHFMVELDNENYWRISMGKWK